MIALALSHFLCLASLRRHCKFEWHDQPAPTQVFPVLWVLEVQIFQYNAHPWRNEYAAIRPHLSMVWRFLKDVPVHASATRMRSTHNMTTYTPLSPHMLHNLRVTTESSFKFWGIVHMAVLWRLLFQFKYMPTRRVAATPVPVQVHANARSH